jgi:putative component of membrane protein insertase Oxa1/YidC/SpoIIIJ protein YidD
MIMASFAKLVIALIRNNALCIRLGSIALVLAILSLGARHIAIGGIGLYQRYISPYKGYACAYRVYYGGLSCSEYGRQVIADEGLVAGAVLLWQRFDECGEAATRAPNFPTRIHSMRCEECDSFPMSCLPFNKIPKNRRCCSDELLVILYLAFFALIVRVGYWIWRRR